MQRGMNCRTLKLHEDTLTGEDLENDLEGYEYVQGELVPMSPNSHGTNGEISGAAYFEIQPVYLSHELVFAQSLKISWDVLIPQARHFI